MVGSGDADAIAVRDSTPELLLPDGGHEAFPLEIAKSPRRLRPPGEPE